jgi:serine protease Do
MSRFAPAAVAALLFVTPAALAQAPTPEVPSLPSLAPLVDSVKASVVNVDVQGPGPARSEEGPLYQGTGSGFIIDPKGLVLTNNHVVKDAADIQVRLDDGRQFEGEVIGRDPATDVALIQLKGNLPSLPSAKLGDSDAIRPGDFVLAIGNPFGLASSASLGIVSAKARHLGATYDDYIQTDAAINPGNSGGPLFNLKGEVIGINTASLSKVGGFGIGFAVPSNIAKSLLPMLQTEGVVRRGFLGINIQNMTPEIAKAMGCPATAGAIVLSFSDGSPAKKAGIEPDDVIVAVDGEKVGSGEALTRLVAFKKPGTTAALTFYRGTRKMDARVTLGTRPDPDNLGVAPRPGKGSNAGQGQSRRIGVSFQDMDARFAAQAGLPPDGALITEVVPGSPADRAELERGVVVVEADHKPVRGADDFRKVLESAKPGTTVLLRVSRPGGGAAAFTVLEVP